MNPLHLLHENWAIFRLIIKVPFEHMPLVWGIVPLYFAWLLNELTSSKASYSTAIQTGFSFIWAGAQWAYRCCGTGASLFSIKLAVTAIVLAIGVVAFLSGIRRRYPKNCELLGHTRFSNYFMITFFPMQSSYLNWSWSKLGAILFFAVPAWCLVYCAVKPFRR